jgi:hypothetical protein
MQDSHMPVGLMGPLLTTGCGYGRRRRLGWSNSWPAIWTGIRPGSLSTRARAAGRLGHGRAGRHGRTDGR